MFDNLSHLHRLTEAVSAAGADIAPSYIEYVQMAFAIATDCGEAGRSDFHRLCSLSAKYDRQAADKLFSNALKTNRNDIHLGTVFHLAELCNVKPDYAAPQTSPLGTLGTPGSGVRPASHAPARINNVADHLSDGIPQEEIPEETRGEDREETTAGSEPLSPLPCFDDQVHWPEPLERIVSHGTTRPQRDVLLLGAVTVLGASMGPYVRCSYGGKMMSPSLQTFIVAPPASGKGVLAFVRLLVESIHEEIRRKVAEDMKRYRQEKAAYEVMGKERGKVTPPLPPLNRMFLISGNNTGTGILQNIMDSDGIGLICESEADTISTAIGSEYGHWSDTMRKAFDHDRLSYNRRTDHEYREVKKSYLSVLLSGTPAQVKPLIPTAENGLFSRQIFYYMPAIHKWKDQFDHQDTDLEEVFTALGVEWKDKLKRLETSGLYTLRLSAGQKAEFNAMFSGLFVRSHLANGAEMSSSVARLGINACRIMEVVAMLRVLETENLALSPCISPDKDIPADNLKDGIITRWNLEILSDDFHAILRLMEILYRHTTHILSFLPDTEMVRRSNSDRDTLLQYMETEFTRASFLQKAVEMGIKPDTASTWLKRLLKRGMIESVDGNGTYRKFTVPDA